MPVQQRHNIALHRTPAWDVSQAASLSSYLNLANRLYYQMCASNKNNHHQPTTEQVCSVSVFVSQRPAAGSQTSLSLQECLRLLEATFPFGEESEVTNSSSKCLWKKLHWKWWSDLSFCLVSNPGGDHRSRVQWRSSFYISGSSFGTAAAPSWATAGPGAAVAGHHGHHGAAGLLPSHAVPPDDWESLHTENQATQCDSVTQICEGFANKTFLYTPRATMRICVKNSLSDWNLGSFCHARGKRVEEWKYGSRESPITNYLFILT